MHVVPIEIFGISADVAFPAPIGFHAAGLDSFASAIAHNGTGLNIRPDRFHLRKSDELFQYELVAHFFGDNGVLLRNSERARVSVNNARTQGDWRVVQETLGRFYRILDMDDETETRLSIHAHARFPSSGARDAFLGAFAPCTDIVRPAALGYVRIAEWEKEVRVLIEQSVPVPNAIFLACDTQYRNNQDWETFLPSLSTVMENSAHAFGIAFEPLRES
jgi:hypothetical protein